MYYLTYPSKGSGTCKKLSPTVLSQSLLNFSQVQSQSSQDSIWLKDLLSRSYMWLLEATFPLWILDGYFHFLSYRKLSMRHLTFSRARNPRAREWKLKAEAVIAYKALILKDIYYHLCCMLPITQSNPGTMWKRIPQGCEDQKIRNVRSYLGGWLPRRPPVKMVYKTREHLDHQLLAGTDSPTHIR